MMRGKGWKIATGGSASNSSQPGERAHKGFSLSCMTLPLVDFLVEERQYSLTPFSALHIIATNSSA
jgi:hypothetical protein